MIKRMFLTCLLGLLYLVSLLPFRVLYFISDGMYYILYAIARYRRTIVAQNLKNAFPEKSVEEIVSVTKAYYHHLADLIVESVKMFSISNAEVRRRMLVHNHELVTDSFKNGQSVIGVLGHYGNWELGALRFSQLFDEPRIIVYKPLSNSFFDRQLKKVRSKFGATLVEMKHTMRKLVQYKNERTVTVLVGDQTPAKSEISYYTNFMNQPTAVFLGVEKLAKLTNSVVVFCDIRKIKRGYYQCFFIPLFNNPRTAAEYEITDSHVQYLEKVIRNQPQYWLWSHRRWKFKPYSTTSSKSHS